jgi:NADP-dependent 3-hydroxy acid dehydrogenase YdfG
MKTFRDRVAVITGAASGIGRALELRVEDVRNERHPTLPLRGT